MRRGDELIAPSVAGRSVSGRVLGSDGRPVEGARVFAGRALLFGFDELLLSGAQRLAAGAVRAISNRDGNYRIDTLPAGPLVLCALVPDGERSGPVRLTDAGAAEVDLRLAPGVAIAGAVPRVALGVQNIAAQPTATGTAFTFVAPVIDGRYELPGLPPGQYDVVVASRAAETESFHRRRVALTPAGPRSIDFAAIETSVTVDLVVRAETAASIPSAQVMLIGGRIEASTGRELNRAMQAASIDHWVTGYATPILGTESEAGRGHYLEDDMHVLFRDVAPGPATACVLPLPGDHMDLDFQRRMGSSRSDLDTVCREVEIAASPAAQLVVVSTPPPQRLPADTP
jgi:hypothetical protein